MCLRRVPLLSFPSFPFFLTPFLPSLALPIKPTPHFSTVHPPRPQLRRWPPCRHRASRNQHNSDSQRLGFGVVSSASGQDNYVDLYREPVTKNTNNYHVTFHQCLKGHTSQQNTIIFPLYGFCDYQERHRSVHPPA